MRPSHFPTSQPTSQPTVQPSTQPTQPTGQPSSQPSFNDKLTPVILEQFKYPNFTYPCHPAHIGDSPNEFMNIFFGLSVDSTVHQDKARIWIEPFDPLVDRLSMSGNDYKHNIVGNASLTGVLEIVQPGGPELTKKDWDDVINMATYKMNINVSVVSFVCAHSFE